MNEEHDMPADTGDEPFDDYEKARVECICPKCGKRHMIQFHWSGKGVPRKYCKKCRSSFE